MTNSFEYLYQCLFTDITKPDSEFLKLFVESKAVDYCLGDVLCAIKAVFIEIKSLEYFVVCKPLKQR